jgi:hypothetical protein
LITWYFCSRSVNLYVMSSEIASILRQGQIEENILYICVPHYETTKTMDVEFCLPAHGVAPRLVESS